MARSSLAVLALVIVGGLSGCRTVWVHPDASQAKYFEDLHHCQYGTSVPTAQDYRDGTVSELPRVRGDWKMCMGALGWSTKVGDYFSKPFGVSGRHPTRLQRERSPDTQPPPDSLVQRTPGVLLSAA